MYDANWLFDEILKEILSEEYFGRLPKSGFIYEGVMSAHVNILEYDPLKAGSWIKIPEFLSKSRSIINPENTGDNQCFAFIAAALEGDEKPQGSI